MGEWTDKLEGKAKELKGKVTGDRSEQLAGKGQQVKGAIEGKVDDLHDSWEQRQEDEQRTDTMGGADSTVTAPDAQASGNGDR